MIGELKYYEPDPLTNFDGGWAIMFNKNKSYEIVLLCDKSLDWVEKNKPQPNTIVNFDIIPICYYDSENKTGFHKFVGRLEFVLTEEINEITSEFHSQNPFKNTIFDFVNWLKVNNYKIVKNDR